MFTYLPLAGICLGCIKFSFVWELLHLQRVFLKVPNLDFSNLPTWISPPACCNCSCLCRAYCPRPGRDPPRNSWNIILQNIHKFKRTTYVWSPNKQCRKHCFWESCVFEKDFKSESNLRAVCCRVSPGRRSREQPARKITGKALLSAASGWNKANIYRQKYKKS